MKRLLLTVAAAFALVAAALPTKEELRKAEPLVMELMKPLVESYNAKKKTATEVGDTAMTYAHKADTEAAKFLLFKGAIWYYAQDRADDKAVMASTELQKSVKNIPPEVMRNEILRPAVNKVSAQGVPGLFAQYRTASARVEIAKLEPSVRRGRADEVTRRRYAELLAIADDWKAALAAFAELKDAKTAQIAKDELAGKTLSAAGDFWWDYKPTEDMATEPIKAHATALYLKTIASGELTGLKKVIAEKRIAEVAPRRSGTLADSTTPRGSGTLAASEALYCVIDLAAGPNAGKYPVSYLDAEPKGGWTDEYKTTKLVLRCIAPGKFMMGGKYDVTLTKPYYIGVFEVTQKQYELVTGSNPSQSKGDMRPVERVSWNKFRGDSATYNCPSSVNVDSSTFIGKIQARTGLNFDLPTEAQWEYACRAGTTSQFNNGGDSESEMKKLGRFMLNQKERSFNDDNKSFAKHEPDGKGGYSMMHTVVGSYRPNAWGLYDMHGNVWEWCLDWRGDLPSGVTDPVGPSSGTWRVMRGGCWDSRATACTSSTRNHAVPSWVRHIVGFRLCMNPGASVGISIQGSDAPAASATPDGKYNFNYKLDDKGNAILCGSPCVSPKPEGVLVVPDKIDGHTVTTIDGVAFKDCDKMTRIVLPPHLEQILCVAPGTHTDAPGAIFRGCSALESIDISKANPIYVSEKGALYINVKKAPAVMKKRLTAGDSVYINEGMALVVYPKTCGEITLARETTRVLSLAFHGCMFKTARLPDCVEQLGFRTFENCPNLEIVEFPKSLKRILPYAFIGCRNMKKVVFNGDAPLTDARRTRGRENLFFGSPKDIVVEVEKGSKGWDRSSTELPERWPTYGSDSRAIRYIK